MSKLAIIQIRGTIRVSFTVKDTLKKLKLKKKHNCRIIEDSPSIKGMVEKIKHLVTWGDIDDETITLLKARGKVLFLLYTLPEKVLVEKELRCLSLKVEVMETEKKKLMI